MSIWRCKFFLPKGEASPLLLRAREIAPNLDMRIIEEHTDKYVLSGILPKTAIERAENMGIHVERGPSFDCRLLPTWVSHEDRFGSPAHAVAYDHFSSAEEVKYISVPEMTSLIFNLAAAYPDLLSVVTLPELTHEARPTFGIRVHDVSRKHGWRGNRGALVISGVHAREWGGPDVVLSFLAGVVKTIVRGVPLEFGSWSLGAPAVHASIKDHDLILVPCVNADGLHFTQTFQPEDAGHFLAAAWRKNRNPHNPHNFEFYGTDINRNYGYLWNFGDEETGSDLFHGTGKFSEPETRNVKWLIEGLGQQSLFIDLHAYGAVALHSWGNARNQTDRPQQRFPHVLETSCNSPGFEQYISPDMLARIQSMASRMAVAAASAGGHARRYRTAQMNNSSLWRDNCPCGTSTDYAFSRQFEKQEAAAIHALTFELGTDSFQRDFREFLPYKAEACAALGAAIFEL